MSHSTTNNGYLGIALLVAEMDGGAYEPVATVSSVSEATEIAQSDFSRRAATAGKPNEAECPKLYRLWVRNDSGAFEGANEIVC